MFYVKVCKRQKDAFEENKGANLFFLSVFFINIKSFLKKCFLIFVYRCSR